jgi:hypothetical protein
MRFPTTEVAYMMGDKTPEECAVSFGICNPTIAPPMKSNTDPVVFSHVRQKAYHPNCVSFAMTSPSCA